MDRSYPILHSQFSPDYLADLIRSNYPISEVSDCKLLASQMNDTYLVNNCEGKYIFKVYRADRKALSEIHDELEMLNFLDTKGIAVSPALKSTASGYTIPLASPEGTRYGGLFKFIEGKTPFLIFKLDYYSYGRTLAGIHKSADDFPDKLNINEHSLEYLMDRSLEKLSCNLKLKIEDFTYLKELSGRLRKIIENIPIDKIDYGFCHGDSQVENTLVDNSGKITFVDFDCCGNGYRAYDIGTFFYALIFNTPLAPHPYLGIFARSGLNSRFKKFLQGYKSIRPLSDENVRLIPAFIAVRHIWTLGLRAEYVNVWGFKYIDEELLKTSMIFIRNYEKLYINRGLPGFAR